MKAGYTYITVILCLIMVVACEIPENPIYDSSNPDPNPSSSSAANITGINPSEGFFDEIVTISGSGFSTTPEQNLVQVGQGYATVLTASGTELTVELPVMGGVTVPCRVAPRGAIEWSNAVDFTFKPAVSLIIDTLDWAMGVAADDNGNIFVGSGNEGVIYKIDSDGNRSHFADVQPSGHFGWGPDGYLYVAQSWDGKIVRISPDGGTVEDYVESEAAVDFDWAENGNMYILRNWGEGIDMYDGSTVTHIADYDGEMKSCRISGGYFYATVIWNGEILRYPITASGLDEPEVIYEGDSPVGLEADVNGNIYFTEAWETTLYRMGPDGSDVTALFEGELMTPMRYLSFHNKMLYIVYPGWGGAEGSVMTVYLAVEEAPNWGLP
jgi:hypothetical protein